MCILHVSNTTAQITIIIDAQPNYCTADLAQWPNLDAVYCSCRRPGRFGHTRPCEVSNWWFLGPLFGLGWLLSLDFPNTMTWFSCHQGSTERVSSLSLVSQNI